MALDYKPDQLRDKLGKFAKEKECQDIINMVTHFRDNFFVWFKNPDDQVNQKALHHNIGIALWYNRELNNTYLNLKAANI